MRIIIEITLAFAALFFIACSVRWAMLAKLNGRCRFSTAMSVASIMSFGVGLHFLDMAYVLFRFTP